MFTVYKCGDKSCNNPPEEDINNDGKIDSCNIEGDVAEGKDDCIDTTSNEVSTLYPVKDGFFDGQTFESSIEYTLDSNAEPGTYIAETYIWTTTNSIVSDTPEEEFYVETESNDDDDPGTGGGTDRYDSDGDGVYNSNDECPYEFGNKDNGCPITDYDGDGVENSVDACPNTYGEKPNGCPVQDSDNDGVIDSEDACPNEAGPVSRNGCPADDPENNQIPVIPVALSLIAVTGVVLYYRI